MRRVEQTAGKIVLIRAGFADLHPRSDRPIPLALHWTDGPQTTEDGHRQNQIAAQLLRLMHYESEVERAYGAIIRPKGARARRSRPIFVMER